MKQSLLYASPMPPQRSGISYYSEALLQGLKDLFDITLLVDCAEIDPQRYPGMAVCQTGELTNWDRFDYRLYNIGDNPSYCGYIYEAALRRPGAVILHDPVLYHLYTGYHRNREDFFRAVFEWEGPGGAAQFKEMSRSGTDWLQYRHPERLPLNGELIGSGNDFLVHSQHALNAIRERARRPFRSCRVNHVVRQSDGAADGAAARRRIPIPPGAACIASFGSIAPVKFNHAVCEAVRRVNRARPASVFYLMVGEGDYADCNLCAFIHKTGYVSEDEFDEYLAGVDLVVNLRHPSMGKASGALLRAFSFAKPCIVCDEGWFSELPKDTVLKLEPLSEEYLGEMLYEVILAYLDRPGLFAPLGQNAQRWAEAECSVQRVAAQVAQFLRDPGGNATP